jgi:hypothetical protein
MTCACHLIVKFFDTHLNQLVEGNVYADACVDALRTNHLPYWVHDAFACASIRHTFEIAVRLLDLKRIYEIVEDTPVQTNECIVCTQRSRFRQETNRYEFDDAQRPLPNISGILRLRSVIYRWHAKTWKVYTAEERDLTTHIQKNWLYALYTFIR